jgi:glycosyltransferase involved in cell wall biosynthesis
MRILFVTQIVPYPPHGGVLQRGYNLLRELGRAHEVHLLAFHHPDELPPGEAVERSRAELGRFCSAVEYFELWPKKSAAHRILGLGMAALHPEPFSVLAQRNQALSRRIAELCNGGPRPDIVHLDTIGLVPFARHCAGVPTVLAHHNIESQLMHRRAEHERGAPQRFYVELQARRLRRYEARECGRFPLNITVSAADAALLGQICPGVRTVVIPNGVDTDYFQPRWGNETPALIFTGGMNMFANRDAMEWFLEAVWPIIKARVPGVRFYAVGQRPSPRVLEVAARDEAVEAPGHVPDVRPWVEKAAIYVVPMRVGGGTRLKVVDAMAQGKAIVSTSLGAEGIEGEDGVHFVLADDAEAFAGRVIELLGQPAERRRLGEAARARAESHYAWRTLGDRLGDAYARVVAEHRR